MKKFLIFFMAVVLNCSVAIAENNLLDREWWNTATVTDVKKEIANGADVNAKDEDGNAVLNYAVKIESPEVVKLLLESGANVNDKNEYGVTPLIAAIRSGQNPVVLKLLLKAGADVNAKDISGKTAFVYAALYGSERIAKVLLDAGANWDAEYGSIILSRAVENNWDPNIIKKIVSSGADVNVKGTDDEAMWHKAAKKGNLQTKKILEEAGAKTDKTKVFWENISEWGELIIYFLIGIVGGLILWELLWRLDKWMDKH